MRPLSTVFGFTVSSGTNSVVVSVRTTSDDSMGGLMMLFILIGLFIVAFAVWIAVMLVKIHNAKKNRVQDAGVIDDRQGIASNRGRPPVPLSQKLTMQLINQHMPVIAYSKLLQQYKQNCKVINESCSVCLSDFQADDICRVAKCNHHYHKDCLESWLTKQENCPNCREDLSREALLKVSFLPVVTQPDFGEAVRLTNTFGSGNIQINNRDRLFLNPSGLTNTSLGSSALHVQHRLIAPV